MWISTPYREGQSDRRDQSAAFGRKRAREGAAGRPKRGDGRYAASRRCAPHGGSGRAREGLQADADDFGEAEEIHETAARIARKDCRQNVARAGQERRRAVTGR